MNEPSNWLSLQGWAQGLGLRFSAAGLRLGFSKFAVPFSQGPRHGDNSFLSCVGRVFTRRISHVP